MSIGLQTGIGFILLLGILVGGISLIIAIFKRNLREIKLACGVLLLCCSFLYGMTEYLSYEYENNLLGLSLDKGVNVVSFSCCYDHHGDGIDVNIFEGNEPDYSSINSSKLGLLPSSTLNLNHYKYEQPWIPISIQNSINKEAIELATQAVSRIDEGQRVKAEKLFNLLLAHQSSLYAYIYDGKSSIDFWLINTELAKFVEINYYN